MRNRRARTAFLLVLLVLVLNLPVATEQKVKAGAREAVAPFQNVMSVLLSGLSGLGSGMLTAGHAAREREELITENASLRLQLRNVEMLKEENRELRRGVGFAERHDHKLVLCRVVVRNDASGWWRTVRLNRGADSGITTNMAVITRHGLIGKTIEVSANTADVLLLTDPTCKVASRVVRTGTLGILHGSPVAKRPHCLDMLCSAAPLQVEYLSRSQKLFAEDHVVTSGLGGVFPEGLPVGRIAEVKMDSSGLYQDAKIIPFAEMGRLKYVFVVVK